MKLDESTNLVAYVVWNLGEILAVQPSRLRFFVFFITAALVLGAINASPALAASDVTGPVFVTSSVSPKSVNIASTGATIEVSVRLTDATGVATPTITMSHDSGQSNGFGSMSLTSGTVKDGTWSKSISIPQGAATGSWEVSLYPLRDSLGNSSDSFRTLETVTVTGAASPSPTPTVAPPVEPREFSSSPVPKISGIAKVGSTLSAVVGTWSPAPSAVKYQWLRGGGKISGATFVKYVPVKADIGKTLTVSVTGSKSGYETATKTSAPTEAVVKANLVVDRVSGADRYATAVAASKNAYPGTAPVVYIATGGDYPDALAAAPAAAKEGGPLLLTNMSVLSGTTAGELKRLKPSKVVIVGGTGAVSQAVFNSVKSLVPNTIRRSGSDRFETARAVVNGAFGQSTTAYIATGWDYPDALSASASAGATGAPILLVKGSAVSVDSATVTLLKKINVTKTVIAGGTGVVSAGLERSLKSFGPVRLSGADRYSTSQKLNAQLVKSADRVFLATGIDFPDALAGSAVAGAQSAPLYVVRTSCIPASILAEINASPATRITLLGGTGTLTSGVQSLKVC